MPVRQAERWQPRWSHLDEKVRDKTIGDHPRKMDTRPGELTFCHGKIHHFLAGKIHYVYGHFPLLC